MLQVPIAETTLYKIAAGKMEQAQFDTGNMSSSLSEQILEYYNRVSTLSSESLSDLFA